MSSNIPALNTPATSAADLVLSLPSESAIAPLRTALSLVAERVLMRPHIVERLIKKHLRTPNGPYHLELVAEVSQWTQERGEVAACSARVMRRIVEG